MRRGRILQTPAQGWLSLFAFLAMLAIVGFAITSTTRVGRAGLTDTATLPILMVAAGLVGFVLARSGVGIVRSHVIGAATAAIILIPVVGSAVDGGDGRPLFTWLLEYEALGPRLAELTAAIRTDATRATEAALLLILGAICWTTGQFGASSIFRFDRGIPAVTAAGVPLLVAVVLPDATVDIVLTLALFTFFSMLLLIRMQLRHQRDSWARRHIADTGEVSRLFMRSGVLFVAFTVVTASTLTGASQHAAIDDVDLGFDLPRLELPAFLTSLIGTREPGPGLSLTDTRAPQDENWTEVPGWAFTAHTGNPTRDYWWVAAWDTWDGIGYLRSGQDDMGIAADDPLPLPAHERAGRGRIEHDIEIGEIGAARTYVVSPAESISLSQGTTVSRIGNAGSRMLVSYPRELQAQDRVRVTSLVLDYDEATTEMTDPALRAAAMNLPYPADIEARYAGKNNAALGPRAKAFADEVEAELKADGRFNAYDAAREIEARFLDPTVFRYNPIMGPLCDEGQSQTECVFEHRQGFCTFFGQAMTAVMQSYGFASRYVFGYLPGEIGPGPSRIDNAWLHAWSEVYLDGFGWVRFDPTPGTRHGQTQFEPPPEEGPEASFDPTPIETLPPGADVTPPPAATEEPSPTPNEDAFIFPIWDSTDGVGRGLLLLTLAGVVFLILALITSVRLLRLPGGDPGRAYRGIVALATRFGHGPRPAQTELEYASALAERIPTVNDEVRLVVDSHVEATYSDPGSQRAADASLRRAYARIRAALLQMRLRRRG